jgi:hypothetical protein
VIGGLGSSDAVCTNASGQIISQDGSFLNPGTCNGAVTGTSDGTISGVTSLNMTGSLKVVGVSPFDTTTITGGTVQSAFVDTAGISNVGNTSLGFNAANTLTVNATSTFNAPVTINGTTTVNGNASVSGILTAPTIQGGGAGSISGFTSVSATQGNFTDLAAASGNFTDVNTKNVTGDGTGTISGFTSVSAGTGNFTTGNIGTLNSGDIVNTGNIGTDSLTANTASVGTLTATTGNVGALNSGNIVNSGNIATGSLTTTGNASVGGDLSVAGTTTLGTLSAGATTLASLNVTGATTTNGITNTGNIATDSLTTTGNATVGGSLSVAHGATVSDSFTVTPGSNIDLGGNVVHNVATPIVGTDAANKQYVDDGLAKAFKAIDRNTQGIAIAMAMSGLSLPDGKNFALGANMGFFDDKQAIAIQAAIRVSPNVTLTGGFGTGVQDMNATGGRVGVQAAW